MLHGLKDDYPNLKALFPQEQKSKPVIMQRYSCREPGCSILIRTRKDIGAKAQIAVKRQPAFTVADPIPSARKGRHSGILLEEDNRFLRRRHHEGPPRKGRMSTVHIADKEVRIRTSELWFVQAGPSAGDFGMLIRRKNFLIDKKLQISILVLNLGYAAILFAVIAAALFAPLVFELRNNDPASVEAYEAASTILYLHRKFWLPVCLTLLLLALHSLKTTHRIAGPLFRFRSIFKSIETGTIPDPLKLRRNDFLAAERDSINRMLASLRMQAGETNQLGARLHELISQYTTTLNQSCSGKLKDDLWDEIVEAENRLLKALCHIRSEDK
jgi:hypothetical protein